MLNFLQMHRSGDVTAPLHNNTSCRDTYQSNMNTTVTMMKTTSQG